MRRTITVTVNGEQYVIDTKDITPRITMEMRRVTGLPWAAVIHEAEAGRFDLDLLAALMWLSLRMAVGDGPMGKSFDDILDSLSYDDDDFGVDFGGGEANPEVPAGS